MIKRVPALFALLLLTMASSAFFMLVIARANLIESLQLKSADSLFAFRANLTPKVSSLDDVVVIGVDDESFKKMNRSWPWGREVFAFFLEKLSAAKPSVVAFDFVFSGVGSNPKADEWWAATMKNSGNVVLASYLGPDGTLVLPLDIFLGSALAAGLVDKPQDVDGACRKARTGSFAQKDWEGYSFAAEAAYRHIGSEPAGQIRPADGGVRYFVPASAGVSGSPSSFFAQTDRRGTTHISYRYKAERFRYVPFWSVLEGRIDPKAFEGKIVLVGPVSPVFHDIHRTPLGQMPGVFANANEVLMIVDKDFIREPLAGFEALAITLFGALFTLLIFRFVFAIQLGVYISCSILVYAACLVLFCRFNILIEPFSPIVVMTLNFAAVACWKALKQFLDNIALQRQVITDSLTGLYGHRFLTLKLGSVFLHAANTKTEFCVAMLDADHFKKVNDTYGHDVGNQVLIGITKVMKQHVRRQDVAARFGGEEFCVILIGTDTKGARECLERMRKAIEELEFTSDKGKFKVTISSGLCSNQNAAVKNSDDMLKLADKALYEAKTQGRNRVCAA